jgi:hypothetical protein
VCVWVMGTASTCLPVHQQASDVQGAHPRIHHTSHVTRHTSHVTRHTSHTPGGSACRVCQQWRHTAPAGPHAQPPPARGLQPRCAHTAATGACVMGCVSHGDPASAGVPTQLSRVRRQRPLPRPWSLSNHTNTPNGAQRHPTTPNKHHAAPRSTTQPPNNTTHRHTRVHTQAPRSAHAHACAHAGTTQRACKRLHRV